MHTFKTELNAGDSFWQLKDGKPFEDKIVKIEVTITEDMQTDVYHSKESGIVDIDECSKTSRDLAIKLGMIKPVTRKRKEVAKEENIHEEPSTLEQLTEQEPIKKKK